MSLDDPTYLEFPYVQVLAQIIDTMLPGPLDAVHLGGGGATLPRWLAAVRPNSAQVVFESNAELLRVVRHRLPLDPAAAIDLRLGDGRSGLAGRPPDSADLVVIDAFSGGRVPAELSTVEFFADVARVLRQPGLLLMNATAAAGSAYLRRWVAAVSSAFPEILVHGERDGTVGNVVVAAARTGRLPAAAIVAQDGALGPPFALSGPALAAFVAGAEPLSDAAPMRSPIPPDATWRVGGEG